MVSLQAPQTPRRKSVRVHHGDTFIDYFDWLKEKDHQQVIDYLVEENNYTAEVTSDQEGLRQKIFHEIKSRVQETDLSVPTRKGDWWYFSRTIEGEQYPVFCRVAAEVSGSVEDRFTPPAVDSTRRIAGEQVLLDCNEFARDMAFFSLGSFLPSLDGRLLTFSVDDSGNERYRQYFKNLETNRLLDETLENISAGAYFTPDAKSLIYSVVDDSWRPYEVRRHIIGGGEEDSVLFTETDHTLWLDSALSRDRSHLVLTSYSSEYSEVRLIPVNQLESTPRPIIDKSQRVQYTVEPITVGNTGYLLIQHDFEALNSELVIAPHPSSQPFTDFRETWLKVLPHQPTVRLESFTLSSDHLVITARENTTVKVFLAPLEQLRELLTSDSATGCAFKQPAGFTEEIYSTDLATSPFDSPVIRMFYTSWVTPTRIYDYFPDSEQLVLRKQTPVLNYDPSHYTAYRLWAPALDGQMVPISIVHRADLDMRSEHPVFQCGYGSYEVSVDPFFSTSRLSLLDRNVIYAVAHVRGGGELGRNWYQSGKKLTKKNTFTDFIAVTDFLAQQPWVNAGKIAIEGGSAGGLLIGAVLNSAPEKYAAAIAQVPFVDALNTILDPDLPLSALEWEEWGNPITDPEVYAYMKSYTPYENIRPVTYPPLVAMTSLNDTRVLYTEPAKWVAKLRQTIAADSPTPLLKIEMDGGHGGGSGRYTQWKETAWAYAFVLNHLLP